MIDGVSTGVSEHHPSARAAVVISRHHDMVVQLHMDDLF